tara:strand:+ start:161 stop:328 length:168 start_codon:yes stop_codon:yes gene_type:complete
MDWLAENWVWILVGIAFIALHFFGHGGHRAHQGDGRTHRDTAAAQEDGEKGRHSH